MESERLVLRALRLDDAADVQTFAGDFDVFKHTLSIPHPYEEGMAEAWIKGLAWSSDLHTYAIEKKGTGSFLGVIGLKLWSKHNRAELSYWLGKPFWGQGYMTEAARVMVAYGFEELFLHRIYAYAFSTNPASARVMQKIGMRYEGLLRSHVMKQGEYLDLVTYGLLRSEYDALRTNQS